MNSRCFKVIDTASIINVSSLADRPIFFGAKVCTVVLHCTHSTTASLPASQVICIHAK